MSRLRLGLARTTAILLTLAFWTWTTAKAAVTLIGASTVGDDFNQLLERLPNWTNWLFSTPWWVPSVLAAALTSFLIWLSWPAKQVIREILTAPETSTPQIATADNTLVSTKPTKASLKIYMARNQEPQELHNENVWRWVTFHHGALREDGTKIIYATQIFIVFDRPITANYRRVVISRSDVRPQVTEFTDRSAIIVIEGAPENDAIDMMFSDTPV